jgi:2-haloacid dehalogenase
MLDQVIDDLPVVDRDQLAGVWSRMDPWPDAVSGLLRLKRRFIITPLSNGSMRQLVGIARHAVLPWDLVLSVELFHAYKPDPRIYRGAIELLQLQPAEVLMVAAHTYDLRAARAEGMQTAFVGRPQEWGPDGSAEAYEPGEFDLVVRDFEDLATQLNC